MVKKVNIFIILAFILLAQPSRSQDRDASLPLLTIKEIMNAIITPMTAIIWGAYDLETDGEWQEVSNAALAVIAAGNLLVGGGAGEGEEVTAVETDWQSYNNQMIKAARQVLVAAEKKDEEALFNAGNDALYPPCESCHQQYQNQ
jgi:cytochrome c556